ncbi:glycoside hydrolase family 43 protein [Cyclobacterium salsum]|uniref:glycoside hydrolase family 43 protein n=1 Tax=Cyclobacterium salsum TaxID=2666329 RepID=UPI001391FEB3|nr:glycoside hydrolase family 43 protein [Cyclobacterium salsum]
MKKNPFQLDRPILLPLILSAFFYFSVFSVWGQEQREETFSNPIFPGFFPDPGIYAVGEDFYLVNSTFSFFPGVPVFHSKDLVHWRQLGHILERPEQMDVEGLGISEGIFAPTIQYHDGVFYMLTTLVGKGGNFVVTATEPEGPWSKPIWLPAVRGIDPSLFFDDDGNSYIIYNGDAPNNRPLYSGHRTIRIIGFDLESLKTVGENRVLVNGGVNIGEKPVWIEGPHIFKTRGYYYLCAAEGGTSVNHSQVIFRTRDLNEAFIPYEDNPILTQRHLDPNRPNPISATGHANLIETKNGEWWAVFLATRPYDTEDHYNIGRETFLAPVKWTDDDWPIINPDYEEVQYQYPRPDLPEHTFEDHFPLSGNFTISDDFDKEKLADYWFFIRVPTSKWYRIADKKLTFQVRPESVFGTSNPSFIGRRQQHNKGQATLEMSFNARNPKEKAGLLLFQNETHHLFLCISQNTAGNAVVQVLKANGEKEYEIQAEQELDGAQDHITLKVDFDMPAYRFAMKQNGDWLPLYDFKEGEYLSTRVAGGFVGVTMGPYASSSGIPSSNTASFYNFTYAGQD